jgi:SAM-dependent methyltransferase
MLLDNASAADGLRTGSGAVAPVGSLRARRHEHRAELTALARLLRGRRFGHAVYIGRGSDRFGPVLREAADGVTIAAPGPLDLADGCADLAVLVSVLQWRPDPADELAEVARVLRPGALAVIGAANVLHGARRSRYRHSRAAVTGSAAAVAAGRYGHHPDTLMLQLAVCGLTVERLLSVSNLRHPVLDRVLPAKVTQAAEYALQAALAPVYFGPSLFFLARKRELG